MSLSESIVAALRARVQAGETYAQLSAKSGIAAPHINRLVNHQADPLKMSLLTFAALFPRAAIYLDGADIATGAAAVDLSDYVPRSDYAALRDQYQDLRDQYQDLRDRYQDLRDELAERPRVPRDERPEHPYRVEPASSTLSHSNK